MTKKARYWQRRRARLKALGVCIRCGRPDERTYVMGRPECRDCLQRRKEWRCLK